MRIIEVSTRRRVTVAMFTLAVVLFGLVSFFRLKVNLLPDLTYPTLTIRTEYPGAAPAEIENLISKPIEETLGVVKSVHRVSSISRSGQSDVVLEFDWGTNMDYAGLDVREKLDALDLPLEVNRPAVLRFDPSLDPIMRFGLFQKPEAAPTEGTPAAQLARQDGNGPLDGEQLKVLRRFAEEEIKKELEAAMGVAAVKVSGGLEDEVQVLIDQARMAQLQLPIEEIAAAAPGVIDLAGRTSLTDAVDLLGLADRVVSNDSGLMHIAAALEKPLVAIFGSTSPDFTPPLGGRSRVVRHSLPCSPCFQRECPLGHGNCLKNLHPRQVIEAL